MIEQEWKMDTSSSSSNSNSSHELSVFAVERGINLDSDDTVEPVNNPSDSKSPHIQKKLKMSGILYVNSNAIGPCQHISSSCKGDTLAYCNSNIIFFPCICYYNCDSQILLKCIIYSNYCCSTDGPSKTLILHHIYTDGQSYKLEALFSFLKIFFFLAR